MLAVIGAQVIAHRAGRHPGHPRGGRGAGRSAGPNRPNTSASTQGGERPRAGGRAVRDVVERSGDGGPEVEPASTVRQDRDDDHREGEQPVEAAGIDVAVRFPDAREVMADDFDQACARLAPSAPRAIGAPPAQARGSR